MRTIRITIPGVTYHLITRFVDRAWYFECDEERDRYLWLLGRAMRESDWKCTSYALMSSHIHLSMVAGKTELESWAKRVNPPFATWMNERHRRIGPLMVRGPKDYAIPPDRVGNLIAYIHNNPVRAAVVSDAAASTWTSHRAYLGLSPVPDWLCINLGFELMDLDREQFASLVASGPDDPCRLGSMRRARRYGQIELGTPTEGEHPSAPVLVRNCAQVRIDPRWFPQLAAAFYRIELGRLLSRSRVRSVVDARTCAVHAAKCFGITNADISAALGISAPAVTNITRRQLDEAMLRATRSVVESVKTLIGAIELRPLSAQ